MEVTVNKCKDCGKLFEDEKLYNLHVAKEKTLKEINLQFPVVVEKTCDFANGGYFIQRSEKYFTDYKDLIIKKVKEFSEAGDSYTPLSYGWFRCLDDGGSLFYGVACRILQICKTCYKEWGQIYYANKCCGEEE